MIRCVSCNNIGHKRSTNILCPFYKKKGHKTSKQFNLSVNEQTVQPVCSKTANSIQVQKVCNSCGLSGHSRITSKNCLNNTQLGVIRCKCGSETHERISFSDCPLN